MVFSFFGVTEIKKKSIPPVLPILDSNSVEIQISFFPDEKHYKVKKTRLKKEVMLLSV